MTKGQSGRGQSALSRFLITRPSLVCVKRELSKHRAKFHFLFHSVADPVPAPCGKGTATPQPWAQTSLKAWWQQDAAEVWDRTHMPAHPRLEHQQQHQELPQRPPQPPWRGAGTQGSAQGPAHENHSQQTQTEGTAPLWDSNSAGSTPAQPARDSWDMRPVGQCHSICPRHCWGQRSSQALQDPGSSPAAITPWVLSLLTASHSSAVPWPKTQIQK